WAKAVISSFGTTACGLQSSPRPRRSRAPLLLLAWRISRCESGERSLPTPPMAEHRPVLLEEAVTALDVREDGLYIDATFGRGGHSRAILAELGPHGRLVALDRDPDAIDEARRIDDPRFTIRHAHFSALTQVL